MAKRLYLVVLVFSVIFVRSHALSVVNNVTVPSDVLTEIFFKVIQNIQTLVNVSAQSDGKYDSVKCVQSLEEIVNKFPALDVLPFIDSWGNIPSGLLYGQLQDIGNFDECIRTSITLSNDTGLVKGQHCFASIPLNSEFELAPKLGIERNPALRNYIKIRIGICVPDVCDPNLISTIFQSEADPAFNISLSEVKVSDCLTAEKPPFNAPKIVGIVVLSIISLLIVLSTSYEVYMKQVREPEVPVLVAFSVITNGRKLFKINQIKSPDSIDCLHGIRVLSMCWIVMGHCYTLTTLLPVINILDTMPWSKALSTMHITMAKVSVDSFFFVSGLLIAWLGFRELDKTNGKLNLPLMYLTRYIRLTPAVAGVVLFYITIYDYVGTGPFKKYFSFIPGDCESNWWVTLLYLQNYFRLSKCCIIQSWYLAVDFHLYILSPLVVIPLWKWGRKFSPVMVILSLFSIGSMIYTYYDKGFTTFIGVTERGQSSLTYFPTHARYPVWLVGIGFGYFMHKNRNNPMKPSKLIQLVGWIICFGIILATIYGPYFPLNSESGTSVFEAAIYQSLKRPGWGIAVAWIVFACHFGFGGIINSFLSHPYWQPLARLTYSFYLVHMAVQAINFGSIRTDVYFSDYDEILFFWNTYGISLVAAIVLTLSFEYPFLMLSKILLNDGKPKQTLERDATESVNLDEIAQKTS